MSGKRVILALLVPLLLVPACSGSGSAGASGAGGRGSEGGKLGTGMGGTWEGGGANGQGGSSSTGGQGMATGGTSAGRAGSTGQGGGDGGAASGGTSGGGDAATGGNRSTGGGAGFTGVGGGAGGSATGGAGGATRLGTGGDGTGGGSGQAGGGSTGTGGTTDSGGATGAGGTTSAGSGGTTGTSALIRNDVFWKDTSGNNIYSQGGGVLQVGGTYYWYGVSYGGAASYAANPTKMNSDTSFVAVTVYSSTDLATWKFEGNALTRASVSAKAAMDGSTWIGRVGAAYNATTKKYVLIGQYLGTPDTIQFFAISDTPSGPFTWDHTQATITNVTNNNCGDQAIFNDDDGKSYIVCSNLEGRSNIYVIPLRPSDFLEAQPATRIFGGAGREGNAMFKANGRYYVCSSDLHGWNASHSYYISATNILGPYGSEGVIGNTDLDFSHVTQTGLFITIKGTTQETVVFGGDRWSDFAGNGIGYNQWMPLTFTGTTPVMQSLSEWSIDAASGTWTVGPGNNYVWNPSFEADRVSASSVAGWTASGGSNATSPHSGRWSWQLSGSIEQKLTGLPNGTYILSVWAKGTSGTLSAKGFGGTDKTTTLSAGSSWTKVSLSDIAVSNGTCTIGISSGSGNVDDFALVGGRP
jgi:hypothetical protein